MRTTCLTLTVMIGVWVPAGPVLGAQRPAAKAGKPSLRKELAALKVPPAWFQTTPVGYDTSKPWKEARLEIRRLLGLGDPQSLRQAMKMTYVYRRKNDIGDGHEFPMYLFLGGEVAWATQAYEAFIQRLLAARKDGYTQQYSGLISCYRHFGEYPKAVKTANLALQHLPEPPYEIMNQAHVCDILGDIYAEMGNAAGAKAYYRKAIQLYPRAKPKFGRHLLPRRAAKVQAKLDLLDMAAIRPGQIRDGTYTGRSLGYVEDIHVTVVVKGSRIAEVRLRHKENIPLGSTEIIPRRIVEAQSLNVQAVTGATTTCDAIRHGALEALRKAGLK
jgi:uncharacterized protein with FMN-binding domain/predicted DNA-binding transcriptional regulator AlpA